MESQIFSTRGKLLSSLHGSERLKANVPTHVAGNEHFLEPCPKYLLSLDTVIRQLDTGHQISLDRGWFSQLHTTSPHPHRGISNSCADGVMLYVNYL